VGAIAWSYVRFGDLPEALALLNGVKPVVVAIVALALWNLARTAVKSRWLGVLAAASLLAVAIGANELLVLAAAGALAALVRHFAKREPGKRRAGLTTLLAAAPHGLACPTAVLASGALTATTVSLGKLHLVFLKAGTFLFGSGYVLFAFLRADLVGRLGWLTERQLLDAIAVGQVTPGPVFTTATFVGYVLGGIPEPSSQQSASFCRHSCSSRQVHRSSRGCVDRQQRQRFWTESTSPPWH
jgi:chromate transporter